MSEDKVPQQQQQRARGPEYQSIGVPLLHAVWRQADIGPVKPLTHEQEKEAQQRGLPACRL